MPTNLRAIPRYRHAWAALRAVTAAPWRAMSIPVVVLCVTLSGCGGANKRSDQPSSSTSAHASSASTSTASPPRALATVDDTAVGQNGPERYQVSLYDLRRDGPFLVLDFGLVCLTPSTSSGCGLAFTFAPGQENDPLAVQTNVLTPSGIGLVDPAGLKELLPVRDSQGYPFTSKLADIHDSLTHLEWVRFPLPSSTTSSLDVVLPDGGPQIASVPITNGPAPTPGGNLQAAPPARFSQPPGSTNTTGLTLPVQDLVETAGNTTGSDSETPGRASVTLRSDVLFRFARSSLTPKAQAVLRSVGAEVKARAKGTVQVTGYTDSIGSDAVNIPLSQARARAVVSALRPLTPGVGYSASGEGSAHPVAPNTNSDGTDNPVGRALNRRVTVVFAVSATARPAPPPRTSATAPSSTGSTQGRTLTLTAADTGATFRATVGSLVREGSLLVLKLNVLCAQAKSGHSCFTLSDLAGIATVPPLPLFGSEARSYDPQALFTISGYYLSDPATGAEYIPVHRTDGVPLTGDLGTSTQVGDSYQVWAYFPAPPPSTTSLTLVDPRGGRLNGVPISASSAAAP